MLSVSVDASGPIKMIENWQRQLSGAVAKSINDTLRQVDQRNQVLMEAKLHKPTPFTLNAHQMRFADPRRLEGEIKIRPIQWDYLRTQILGIPTDKTIIPGRLARLNVFGNIPGKKGRGLQALIKRRGDFVGKAGPRGTFGAWRREQGRLHLLGLPVRNRANVKRLPWLEEGMKVVEQRWPGNFERELRRRGLK